MRTTLRLILTLLAAALLLSACGDETESKYIDGYNAAANKMSAAGDAFTESDDVESFDAARKKLDEAIGAFDALTPPADVKGDHKALLAALRSTSTAADRITENSSGKQDEAAMNEALEHLDSASKSAAAIRKALEG